MLVTAPAPGVCPWVVYKPEENVRRRKKFHPIGSLWLTSRCTTTGEASVCSVAKFNIPALYYTEIPILLLCAGLAGFNNTGWRPVPEREGEKKITFLKRSLGTKSNASRGTLLFSSPLSLSVSLLTLCLLTLCLCDPVTLAQRQCSGDRLVSSKVLIWNCRLTKTRSPMPNFQPLYRINISRATKIHKRFVDPSCDVSRLQFCSPIECNLVN